MTKLSREEIKKRLQKMKEESASNEQGDYEKLKYIYMPKEECKILVRFIPEDVEINLPGVVGGYHWTADKKKYKCPRHTTSEKNCPVCDVMDKAKAELGYKEVSFRDTVSVQTMYNVVYLGGEGLNEPPKKFEHCVLVMNGTSLREWLIDSIFDDEVGDVANPFTGNPVTIKRLPKKGNSKAGKFEYSFSLRSGPILENKEDLDTLLANKKDFSKFLNTPPSDEDYAALEDLARVLKDKYDVKRRNDEIEREELLEKKEREEFVKGEIENAKEYTKEQEDQANAIMGESSTSTDTIAEKPKGAPSCFGCPKTFDGTSDECILCSYSIDCEDAVEKVTA